MKQECSITRNTGKKSHKTENAKSQGNEKHTITRNEETNHRKPRNKITENKKHTITIDRGRQIIGDRVHQNTGNRKGQSPETEKEKQIC